MVTISGTMFMSTLIIGIISGAVFIMIDSFMETKKLTIAERVIVFMCYYGIALMAVTHYRIDFF